MEKQIVRTHDKFYLNEKHYDNPKDLFKEAGKLLQNKFDASCQKRIADFGCAVGDFPYYLKKIFPQCMIEGYDLLPELIEKARHAVPGVEFFQGSVLDPHLCDPAHADVCLMIGVIGIFDSFIESFNNLIAWTKPGGTVIVHGLFNNFPLDVNVKYSHADDYADNKLESGWNIFSKKSISRFLAAHAAVSSHQFHDFTISVDLAENPTDPVRSWTFKNMHGERIITNGLALLQPHALLEITLHD